MTERDFWGIMGILGGIAIVQVLQSAVLRKQADDIRYLYDHAVTRETVRED